MKCTLSLGRVVAVALVLGASAPAFAQRDWNDGNGRGRDSDPER